jgi:hypothetical protein
MIAIPAPSKKSDEHHALSGTAGVERRENVGWMLGRRSARRVEMLILSTKARREDRIC